LAERSAPGDPQPREAELEEQRGTSSTERFEQFVEDQRRGSGAPDEQRIGPFAVDVLRVGRIARGLPEAIRGSQARPPVPAELSAEVLSAIRQVDRSLLTPPGASPGDYADAQEVAGALAREMDAAHRERRDSVVLRLGANYGTVRDPASIFDAIRRITRQMRAALPHHAPGVRTVNVMFGDRVVRWLPIDSAAD
jgi:hypothetical protein